MRPIFISRALAAAVANSIATAQTLGGAGPLTLNGSLATGGVATIAVPSQVTLASTANLSAVNFTIAGTDYRGQQVSEVLAGPNNNTVTSVNTYSTVTSITASGAVGTNMTAGNAASGSSSAVPIDVYANPSDVSIGVDITGTANVTIQYTLDDIFKAGVSLDSLVWYNHSQMTNLTASNAGTIISSVSAVRMVTNSGTGTAVLIVRQSGGTGAA